MFSEYLLQTAHDARVAVRLWTRRPGLAIVALITIALGVGAPTAMFSVLNAVLLQPLPYRDPQRIVSFSMESRGPRGSAAFDAIPAAFAIDWMLNSQTLESVSLYNDRALTLSTADGPFRLTGTSVAPTAFDVLGVSALVGHTFDAKATDGQQVILSFDTWQRFFGGRPTIVGSSIALDGVGHMVQGVMPQEFDFPTTEAAFWVPLITPPGGGRGMLLPAIGRMKAGASAAAVEAEGRQLLGSDDGMERLTLHARTLHEQLVGSNQRLLWTLMAAVGMVSIIATTNIALLLLVRGATRTREFSIRLATGAPRSRLLRQTIVESALLAGAGGLAGVALAAILLRVLLQLAPQDIPRLQDAAMNQGVLLFALGLVAAATMCFGIVSAGRAVTVDVLRALTAGGEESSLPLTAPSRWRLNTLAIVEVALTLVLLVGAGLLMRSFLTLLAVDYGFSASRALALQISLPSARYATPADRMAFHEGLLERLRQLPGIDAAGIAMAMPNRQPTARYAYDPSGPPNVSDPTTLQVAETRTVSDGLIEAMGIPLRAGRTFRPGDADGGEPVIVISEQLARLHFGDETAVGRLLYSGGADVRRVIGVVGDVRPSSRRGEPSPAAYLPTRQDVDVFRWFGTLNIVVRGDGAEALAPTLRALVLSLDPEMPPFNVRTLEQEVSRLVAAPRFSASALSAFAFVALALAAVGLYGIVSYAASQRTREFGVRVALGATRTQVLWLVLREGVGVIAFGLAAGVVVALWLGQTIAGMLHDVQPTDPASIAAVVALLAVVGLTAILVPAHRATRISPTDALRGSGG